MQDDSKDPSPTAPSAPAPRAPASGATPDSQADTNAPGMTNGIPDQIHDGESKGRPSNERADTESMGEDAKP